VVTHRRDPLTGKVTLDRALATTAHDEKNAFKAGGRGRDPGDPPDQQKDKRSSPRASSRIVEE